MTETPLTPEEIRDRIVEVKDVRFGDVANHPINPKRHGKKQREAFRGAVREIGFGSVPVAYYSERNEGRLTWADGHLRSSEVADYVGKVAIADWTDAEADYYVATGDPIAALARADHDRYQTLRDGITVKSEAVASMLDQLVEESRQFAASGGEIYLEIDNSDDSRDGFAEGAQFVHATYYAMIALPDDPIEAASVKQRVADFCEENGFTLKVRRL